MYRKTFISCLLLALINFLFGCYSYKSVTVTEIDEIEEKDKPNNIRLTTKDSQEYHFSDSHFYIENDTLYLIDRHQQLDRKIALSEIESIEFEHFNWLTTSLLVLGIGAISFVVAVIIVFTIYPFGGK